MITIQFLLTALVVVIAPGTGVIYTLALGLAIVVRINECYGTIEEREILDAD